MHPLDETYSAAIRNYIRVADVKTIRCGRTQIVRIRSTVSIFGIAPAALVVLALAVTVSAESVQFVKVRDFRKGELYCKGFEVKKPTSIHISAIGAASSNDQYLSAYAWIIPAGNLEPVWIMDDSNTDEAEADDDAMNRRPASGAENPGAWISDFDRCCARRNQRRQQ